MCSGTKLGWLDRRLAKIWSEGRCSRGKLRSRSGDRRFRSPSRLKLLAEIDDLTSDKVVCANDDIVPHA